MLLHAVRTIHGIPTRPTTPYTQFASPTIVLLPLNFRLVFGNDDFSKKHSAMDDFSGA
jgi:hypothetical protein